MATISYYFIVLSVCVVCTFADGRFKKDDLALYTRFTDSGAMFLVSEDGKNPQNDYRSTWPGHGNKDAIFFIKPHLPVYDNVIKQLDEMEIDDEEKYKIRMLFYPNDWRFGEIEVEEVQTPI
ncbi:uncharacterized protein LOC126833662 [Adelges cooleyi]|uniref:uncharacterized protein LOC126833662 n=1 Tax=Adelges cooleyi TaxID=133065 RepID=UPI0021803F77|nr:uncharacterized protein LOC126833662 [Adelges cooleyi]